MARTITITPQRMTGVNLKLGTVIYLIRRQRKFLIAGGSNRSENQQVIW
jgi:hypothetical protein